MSIKSRLLAAAAAAAILAPGLAAAQVSASAVTALNVRAGPGPQHEVIATIPANAQVTVGGCLENSAWCEVNYNGTQGWAYSSYLATDSSGQQMVIAENRATVSVPVARYDGGSTVTGAAGGAIAGALIAGPVGAAIGGVAGAAIGATIDPPAEVRTYVTANAVDPVYLEGEVVVGAGVPDTVTLHSVPDYEYRYAYVNRQPVLVDPQTRAIVYVYR